MCWLGTYEVHMRTVALFPTKQAVYVETLLASYLFLIIIIFMYFLDRLKAFYPGRLNINPFFNEIFTNVIPWHETSHQNLHFSRCIPSQCSHHPGCWSLHFPRLSWAAASRLQTNFSKISFFFFLPAVSSIQIRGSCLPHTEKKVAAASWHMYSLPSPAFTTKTRGVTHKFCRLDVACSSLLSGLHDSWALPALPLTAELQVMPQQKQCCWKGSLHDN